jgi:[FeFe] hydrogenase H-cluster maturation GTPase HydF
LNALVRQQVSIVSEVAGTTTDPVEKPMELLPIGPVLFIDTAGIDDVGALGQERVKKTRQVLDRTDVGLLVVSAAEWGAFEESLLEELRRRGVPLIVVWNKSDLGRPPSDLLARLKEEKIASVETVASQGKGVSEVRDALIQAAPEEFINSPPMLSDLVPAGELAVLVVPIDKEAPKGRLIQPQVQAIRELLDGDAYCIVVKEHELGDALDRLKRPPALVVTDSQAFAKVAEETPREVMMTSFSILLARQKGDLAQFVHGALAIDDLKPGDRVLIAETCAHHPIADDIGRVKIPRWLRQHVGGPLDIRVTQGRDFPDDLADYRLVVHCGACMWNRREVLTRMIRCREAGVPIGNYGMTIAYTLGILDRALEPFPEALEIYRRLKAQRSMAQASGGSADLSRSPRME